MKKFACLVIIMTILCLFIPVKATANANFEQGYARIIDQKTPFYSDENGLELLFYLPYTYYVKVINSNNAFYHVEYGGFSNNPTIDGYVPKTALFFDGLTVEAPYPSVSVSSFNSCALYQTFNMNKTLKHIFKNRKIMPYGHNYAPNGEICYYVSYNDTLGYVYESDLSPFTILDHKNPLTFLSKEPEPDTPAPPTDNEEQQTSDSNNYFSLRIVIIICLVFAGIISVFVAVKGATKKSPDFSAYYEENDYE